MNLLAAISEDMSSGHLPKGLSVGTILWIKELTNSDAGGENYGLPSKCFKHPCVVLHLSASMKGFAQIYVITSKGGRNVNDLPLSAKVRGQYVPIRPTPFNSALPGLQLHLAGDVELRKDSYVNTEKVYNFPLSKLELYDRKRLVTDFCLDSNSVRWLRQKAFGESVSGTPIKPIVTSTSSTSKLPSSQYIPRPLPQYASQLPSSSYNTIQPLPQYVAAPSARPQTATTVGITSFPQRPRRRNPTEFTVLVVAILVLLATAVLIVSGVIVWVMSGFYV